MVENSRIPKFYSYTIEKRREIVKDLVGLNEEELKILASGNISDETIEVLSENVIGQAKLPFSIATNFKVNGKDYLVPMVIEESSVVAAASNAAKIARKKGGFKAEYSGSIGIGQLQILKIENIEQAKKKIIENKSELLDIANNTNKILVKLGGGAKDIELREVKGNYHHYLILHLIVDTVDAMGANAINTMLETIAPKVEEITGGKVLLRILSNYSILRMVKVSAVFDREALGGEDVVNNILYAYDFAHYDTFRAVTHNKGIMNGIIGVLLATGNDTRAVEAAAHAYAARDGYYRSLTHYKKDENGDLVGYLEMPLSVGIVGGAINVNPIYKIALKILEVNSAKEFAQVVGSVGLAQNLAALRALATEGIQKGHMKLHAENIAITAGAKGNEIKKVAEKLVEAGRVTYDAAVKILAELRKKS